MMLMFKSFFTPRWLLVSFLGFLTVFDTPGAAAQDRKIYHWPVLKLDAYISAKHIYYPNGDIDSKRAFYWGRVLGSDGLAFTIRGLLPHLVEGNWQEPVYNNQSEKTFIFDKIKSFQDTYAAQGCWDNFLQVHAHPPLGGQTVAQWRAAVIEGMRQKAELAAYAGFRRILLDLEFSDQNSVSTDPNFWYDLGQDIMTAMRAENTDFMIGFYPGLYGYYFNLTEQERTNPRSIGAYPTESSIPQDKRNMRHALLEGIYSNLDGIVMWHFPGWTYSANHLCSGEPPPTYVFDLDGHITTIIDWHTAAIGPGLQFVFPKWDIGKTQPAPVYKHWKQPNISLAVQARNYDIVYQHSDSAAVWDDYGGWDEDGSYYLTYNYLSDFYNDIASIGFESGYSYDTLLQQEHHIVVPASATLEEKLNYFEIYTGTGGYHVTGKLAENFTDYVNTLITAAGKDQQIIPLANEDEYNWALEYKSKGFFQNREVLPAPGDPNNYGYIWPASGFRDSDINGDGYVNLLDFALLASEWLNSLDPAASWPNGDCILGFELQESGDLGPYGHTLYSHGAVTDPNDYAPGGYSTQSLSCRGAPPRFTAVVGMVPQGNARMSWVTWLKVDSAMWAADPNSRYYLFDGSDNNWYDPSPGEFTCYITETNRRVAFEFGGAGGPVGITYGGENDPPEQVGVPLDTWLHLAIVFDAGRLTMYWDGVEKISVATAEPSIPPNSLREIRLGQSPGRASDWAGGIDEFAIFPEALNEQQIQNLISSGLAVFTAAPPQCGDPGVPYLPEDLNSDCVVNNMDLSIFMSNWLQ